MSASFNGLTPAEAERLALLAEECGEVVQIIGKILRHGYESTHPEGGPTNREALAREVGDIFAVVEFMRDQHDDLSDMSIEAAHLSKNNKLVGCGAYLHHQEKP